MRAILIVMQTLTTNLAYDDTYEVKMLNRGEKGAMVCEPDLCFDRLTAASKF